MIDEKKYEGHTPADQWTIYKMGADNFETYIKDDRGRQAVAERT